MHTCLRTYMHTYIYVCMYIEPNVASFDRRRDREIVPCCNETRPTLYLFSRCLPLFAITKISLLFESNACQTCHRSRCITGDLKLYGLYICYQTMRHVIVVLVEQIAKKSENYIRGISRAFEKIQTTLYVLEKVVTNAIKYCSILCLSISVLPILINPISCFLCYLNKYSSKLVNGI